MASCRLSELVVSLLIVSMALLVYCYKALYLGNMHSKNTNTLQTKGMTNGWNVIYVGLLQIGHNSD